MIPLAKHFLMSRLWLIALSYYSSFHLYTMDMFQETQWIPETVDSTKPCVYY